MAKIKLVTIRDITQFGNFIASSVRSRLRWSKQLRNSVVLSPPKERDGSVSISVSVGENKVDRSGRPLSGMARAFEYGSGLKATRAIRAKYVIVPFRKPFLRFSSTLGEHSGKIIRVSKVMHPGVDPRPFMQPAIQEARSRAVPELRLAIKRNLVNAMNTTIREIKGNYK